MRRTEFANCNLCDATCGLEVEHDGAQIHAIRGDRQDPCSRGYICPKAAALRDVHEDPNRVSSPLKRVGDRFVEISWDEAFSVAGEALAHVQRKHGKDAVALYVGNPMGHSYTGLLGSVVLNAALGTKNRYSSQSVDSLPRVFAAYHMYGNVALLPVPDLERTDFLLMLGANPVVSNGSIMTTPNVKAQLRALKARGAELVVVDPRRTETAEFADEHVFIRPGSDAFLLLGMLHVTFEEELARPGRLRGLCDGWTELQQAASRFGPERVTNVTGIAVEKIRDLARRFARAERAACYGRIGTCTQRFGALSSWLFEALNIVTGNLDRPGGMLFNTPAADLPALAKLLGLRGSYATFFSRVRGLPEFAKELPSAALAEEIETPGPGQVCALVTCAGNPVLSLANGARIERALPKLDFMLSVDIYVNETTRHANIILPTTVGLEREDYPLLAASVGTRNRARYGAALLEPRGNCKSDWHVLGQLAASVLAKGGRPQQLVAPLLRRGIAGIQPRQLLKLMLRLGPHRLRLEDLGEHGLDLGPLKSRLPAVLATSNARIQLSPTPLMNDLSRLEATLATEAPVDFPMLLIGRRHLRSNNSWMHNCPSLISGKQRCTLLMHPDDAARAGLKSDIQVRVSSRVGSLVAPLEISPTLMPGVVSLPHGFGHGRAGVQLDTARQHAGVSMNDITDDADLDALSGASTLNGIPVRVEPASRKA